MGGDRRPGVKFALFAAVCAVAAVWLFVVIANVASLGSERYAVRLPDTSGLGVDDPVRVAGVRVGRVRAAEIERGAARVEFDLERDVPITSAWAAQVRWRDLLGQRYLQLEPREGGEPLEPGEALPAERALPVSDIGRLVEDLTPVLRAVRPDQANELLDALGAALHDRAERNQRALERLASLTRALADRDETLAGILDDGAALARALAAQDAAVRDAARDLGRIGETLGDRGDELLAAIDDLADGQGELARLMTTNEARLRAAVRDLAEIADSFGENRDDFRAAVATGPEGLAGYMLISRWGQWFNIRGVAVQVQRGGEVLVCRDETGAACAEPAGGGAAGASGGGGPGAARGGAGASGGGAGAAGGLSSVVGRAAGDAGGAGAAPGSGG